MRDVAIRIERLGKRYRIGERRPVRDLRQTLGGVAARSFRTALRRRNGVDAPPRSDDLWALREVSLEVAEGEVIGIIGRNGAGKSTLLKILSRITEPTEGSAVMRGRVASLLEIGTGFHPQLTGRENVFLNGAILGLRRAEIERRFDEIVDFSGVERFLDTPVKRYSSGMYVRLAFAVAAHIKPDILIVDEVLAVGDAEFQKKCLGKLSSVSGSGRTVLFVSHGMQTIRALCRRTVLLEAGRVRADGRTEDVIDLYTARTGSGDFSAFGSDRIGLQAVQVRRVRLLTEGGEVTRIRQYGEPLIVEIETSRADSIARDVRVDINIYNNAQSPVACFSNHSSEVDVSSPIITASIDKLPLAPGEYYANIGLYTGRSALQDLVVDAFTFEVAPSQHFLPDTMNVVFGHARVW